jgi:hypothetical protein
MPDDPITAALDMLAAHAERLTRLDARADSHDQAATRTTDLAAWASKLDHRITVLAARLDKVIPPGEPGWDDPADTPYIPAPPRPWWKLAGRDLDDAVTALRAWVDQVYRPGYGHLAASLGPCWDQHPLCLYALDIAAELWSVLYLTSYRPASLLSAQAEYQARILPAFADQMTAETSRCRHRRDTYHSPARPVP